MLAPQPLRFTLNGEAVEVQAAPLTRLDLLDGVSSRRIDRVGGAESPGRLELPGDDIHRDDPRGADQNRSLDDVQSDTARADDDNVTPGLHLRGACHGADAGGDGTPEEGRLLERDVIADRYHRRLGNHRVLGHGSEATAAGRYPGATTTRTWRNWKTRQV